MWLRLNHLKCQIVLLLKDLSYTDSIRLILIILHTWFWGYFMTLLVSFISTCLKIFGTLKLKKSQIHSSTKSTTKPNCVRNGQHFLYGIKYTCINSLVFKYVSATTQTASPRSKFSVFIGTTFITADLVSLQREVLWDAFHKIHSSNFSLSTMATST